LFKPWTGRDSSEGKSRGGVPNEVKTSLRHQPSKRRPHGLSNTFIMFSSYVLIMGVLLFGIVLLTLAILFLTEREAAPDRLKDTTVFFIFLGMSIPLIVSSIEHLVTNPELNNIAIIGGVLFIEGVLLRVIARRTLGKFFTYEVAVKKHHHLVTLGVYRYLRHPLYTGILLLWFGAMLLLQSKIGLFLVMLILVPALWHRMKKEEAYLIKIFGKRYLQYMQTTKRIIPFVY